MIIKSFDYKKSYLVLYLINNLVNIYIYNNKDLIMEYYNKTFLIKRFILNQILFK